MAERREQSKRLINWERASEIFGDPQPPQTIREQQFDGMGDELKRLAMTPYKEMDFGDLWHYYHNLAYVELQPELFDYLFPVCLMDWHQSLMRNESCSHGDAEFHYGVHRGDVFQKMMTAERREAVFAFFRDSFVERLDMEYRFSKLRSSFAGFAWIQRFNSLGIVMPQIETVWNGWWSLDSIGCAVSALQYCSGLMYFDGENPLYEKWGCPSPWLWGDDSMIFDSGWMVENVDFLSKTLTESFVREKVMQAADRLKGRAEQEQAARLVGDLPRCADLIHERASELPSLLADPNAEEWTV